MPYVQILRAFSCSVIALCKKLYRVPFDVDDLFFTTFLQNAKCIILGGLRGHPGFMTGDFSSFFFNLNRMNNTWIHDVEQL